jgi:hypothetical protein
MQTDHGRELLRPRSIHLAGSTKEEGGLESCEERAELIGIQRARPLNRSSPWKRRRFGLVVTALNGHMSWRPTIDSSSALGGGMGWSENPERNYISRFSPSAMDRTMRPLKISPAIQTTCNRQVERTPHRSIRVSVRLRWTDASISSSTPSTAEAPSRTRVTLHRDQAHLFAR